MNKPRMFVTDIVAAFLAYLGFLLIYFITYIFMMNSVGPLYDIFQTLFKIMSLVFYASLVFGVVGILVFFIRFAVWYSTTPKWERDGNGKRD